MKQDQIITLQYQNLFEIQKLQQKKNQMSNKNLKVYKIAFITEIKTFHLNVKFPCEIKMIWKRSNESAQTQRVKLVDGKAEINQRLKLNVNMYCDTHTGKFVEKKCIYSFLIFTQKGQKSAGSVTYDLADFFNKRLYEIEDSFPLQKCPVKDTKVDMKIHYEESVQSGYDSMSQISVSSEMDTSSSNPLDLSELNESKDLTSEKSNSTVEASRLVEPVETKQQQQLTQQDYGSLNESDVESEEFKSRKIITEKRIEYSGKDNKIGENIKGIEQVTHKLNNFAVKFKQNLNYDLEQKKRKITKLTEQLQSAQQVSKRLQSQLSQERSQKDELQLTLSNLKSSLSNTQGESSKRLQELERKLEQQKRNNEKLQKRLTDQSQKGEEEGRYIQELKDEFKKEENYLKEKYDKLSEQLKAEKGQRLQIEARLKRTEENHDQLNEKYDRLLNKYENLESDLRKREVEIEEARINLDRAVQDLVDSLSTLI